MLRRLYTFFLVVVAPVLLARDVRRSGLGRRTVHRERAGRGTPPARIWIHASSVGEAGAAWVLVDALRRVRGDLPLLVTAFTTSGRARLRALLPATVVVRLAPFDRPRAVRRVLREGGVRLLVLVETELWPNLLAEAAEAGVPVAVVSARLGPRTLRRRRLLRALLPDLARVPSLVAAQGAADARRFRLLGVPESRVRVCGNLKTETREPLERHSFRPEWEKRVCTGPVWVAGSTHEGEETLLLNAQKRLRAFLPGAVLVLAPRHPQRARAVRREAVRAGFDPVFWSEARAVAAGGVLVVDALGLLTSCYARAGLVFVGGSLVPVGGHDPLEPARAGRPVLIGPYHAHCREAVRRLERVGALAVVADVDALERALATLLSDLRARARMGRRGALEVRRMQGSVLAAVLPPLLALLPPAADAEAAAVRAAGSG